MPSEFRSLYPGKTKESYNKCIRAEQPGGNELLDLLQLVNQVRQRGRIDNPADFLRVVEERLQQIRDAHVEQIRDRYQIGPIRNPLFQSAPGSARGRATD